MKFKNYSIINNSTSLTSFTIIILWLLILVGNSAAQRCGKQADGALCPNSLCCGECGWCGDLEEHCGAGCQSQCSTVGPIITPEIFETMLSNRGIYRCPGKFYTHEAFITAAKAFPQFGTNGSLEIRKRELAAFFGQTSVETRAGRNPQYNWGYCKIKGNNQSYNFCVLDEQWPCVSGQKYFARGPMQIQYNYNYGPAGHDPALGVDLLNNPDMVATDAVISFKTAIWFWMTAQGQKPSCHDVITGAWTPTRDDRKDKRFGGYGVVTNIINGTGECGHGTDLDPERIGYYKRYCNILKVAPGDHLDCIDQTPFPEAHKNPYPKGVLEMPVVDHDQA